MRYLGNGKIGPQECEDTADLDKLFDSFNCHKNKAKHFQFWKEILPILKSFEFKKNIFGTETKKHKNYVCPEFDLEISSTYQY